MSSLLLLFRRALWIFFSLRLARWSLNFPISSHQGFTSQISNDFLILMYLFSKFSVLTFSTLLNTTSVTSSRESSFLSSSPLRPNKNLWHPSMHSFLICLMIVIPVGSLMDVSLASMNARSVHEGSSKFMFSTCCSTSSEWCVVAFSYVNPMHFIWR